MRSFMSGMFFENKVLCWFPDQCLNTWYLSPGYYDRLTKLYKHLNIPVKRANFSFGWYSVHSPYVDSKSGAYESIELKPQDVTEKATTTSYLLYSGSRSVGTLAMYSRARQSLSAFLIWLYHSFIVTISYFQLLILATWHHATGHLQNERHAIASMTLGQWFQANHFHPFFVRHVFVPLFAAVCTNSWESMLKYPAADVLGKGVRARTCSADQLKFFFSYYDYRETLINGIFSFLLFFFRTL